MAGFFCICEYLDVMPQKFFDRDSKQPVEQRPFMEKVKKPSHSLHAYAIQQIRERDYPAILKDFGGEVVLSGIDHDMKKKAHSTESYFHSGFWL